jgi:proline racemase
MDPTEDREFLRSQADWIRRLAIMEPRGHRLMFGAAIIRASRPDAPFSVVYMDAGEYPAMKVFWELCIMVVLSQLPMKVDIMESSRR